MFFHSLPSLSCCTFSNILSAHHVPDVRLNTEGKWWPGRVACLLVEVTDSKANQVIIDCDEHGDVFQHRVAIENSREAKPEGSASVECRGEALLRRWSLSWDLTLRRIWSFRNQKIVILSSFSLWISIQTRTNYSYFHREYWKLFDKIFFS